MKCKGNRGEYYNLQNSLSFIKDEILVINFDNNFNTNNSIIGFENSKNEYNIINKAKKKGNSSAGAIVAIVLVIIVAIAGTITTFIIMRRRKNKKYINSNESTLMKIKV